MQNLHVCASALVLGALIACSKQTDLGADLASSTNGGGNGANVGSSTGANVGSSTGANVGSSTGANVGSSTGANVGGSGANVGGSGANVGGSGANVGGSGANVGGAGANLGGTGTTTFCPVLACGPNSCGVIADDCGNSLPCGYANCANNNAALCGVIVPNECAPCVPITDCATTGKNCGPVSDDCGGFLDCGICTLPECCGCGGIASVCGGGAGGPTGTSVSQTCIAGTKGCLCDSTGGCAPGLTCTTQAGTAPALCCIGTDCAPVGGGVGATCGATTGAATCTPGVTVPPASGTNDNCGYLATSFYESSILCGIFAQGGGSDAAQIQAFYNDEHALALGCATSAFPVSTLPGVPGSVFYPQTGDPKCVDPSARPLRPSLYITDITSDPNCRAGDQQEGGAPYDPVAVFGVWKPATMATNFIGTPNAGNPTPYTYWNLGTLADPVPSAAATTCPCTSGNCVTTGRTGRGYAAEVRYEAGLISGHSYRLQVQMHDGDQTQGGDAGEACVIFCAGTGSCKPLTCADYPAGTCGMQPDGCGGLTPVCASCCVPPTCEMACPAPAAFVGPTCQTVYDSSVGMILPCTKSDNCGGQIACWCPVG